MKVPVIIGSPRGEHGNTQIPVKEFLEGAKEAGGRTEIVFLKKKSSSNAMFVKHVNAHYEKLGLTKI